MTRPKPDLHDPEYVAYAQLFLDITRTDFGDRRGPLFSVRRAIADRLWALGYRKTDGYTLVCSSCHGAHGRTGHNGVWERCSRCDSA